MKKLNFFKKDTGSNVLAETISLSLIFYIVLVCFALCIGLALTTIFGTATSDIPSVLSNMFVWSATLIAPLVVILLINSWKSQKDYELRKEIATKILNDTHSIEMYVIDVLSMIKTIKDINNYLVIYSTYLSEHPTDLLLELKKSYANIKIFNELYDKDFGEKFSRLQIYCFRIDEHIKELNSSYSIYYQSVIEAFPDLKNVEKSNFKRLYPIEDFKVRFNNVIELVNNDLGEIKIEILDTETDIFIVYAEFKSLRELVIDTKLLINDLQNNCINYLKV